MADFQQLPQEPAQRTIDELRRMLLEKAPFHPNRSRCIKNVERAELTLGPYAELELEIVEARNLFSQGHGMLERIFGDCPDAFVKIFKNDVPVRHDGDQGPFVRTSTVHNEHNPRWDFKYNIHISVPTSVIRLHVYDDDCISASDPLGFVEFNVGELPWDEWVDGWLELVFPEALQGKNTDRIKEHSEKRYEVWHKEFQAEMAKQKQDAEARMKRMHRHCSASQKDRSESKEKGTSHTPLLAEVESQPEGESHAAGKPQAASAPGHVKSSRIMRMNRFVMSHTKKALRKATSVTTEAVERVSLSALHMAEAAVHVVEEEANAMLKIATRKKLNNAEEHHNAGELHVRLRLKKKEATTRCDTYVAMSMQPKCTDFRSFTQAESLPGLDLQEIVDDAMDIYLKVVGDMLLSIITYVMYILAWRNFFISGLVFAMVAIPTVGFAVGFNDPYGDIGQIVWHAGLMILLALNAITSLREDMTTAAWNAPSGEVGWVRVCAWNSVQQVNDFLSRTICEKQGEVLEQQELYEFAGKCFVQGKPLASLAAVLAVLDSEEVTWVDIPKHKSLNEGELVYIDSQRRGEVVGFNGDKVRIEIDADALGSPQTGPTSRCKPTYEEVDPQRVTPRVDVPWIPMNLLPKSCTIGLRMAGMQCDKVKKQLIPILATITDTFTWKKPKYTMIIMTLLALRVALHVLNYMDFIVVRFMVESAAAIRNFIIVLVFLLVTFSQSFVAEVGVNLLKIIFGMLTMKREAPKGWAFFTPAEKASAASNANGTAGGSVDP